MIENNPNNILEKGANNVTSEVKQAFSNELRSAQSTVKYRFRSALSDFFRKIFRSVIK